MHELDGHGAGDGVVAARPVDDVRVLGRHEFDPEQAYGRRHPGRPEPRPITCGGTFRRALGAHTANVVVPARLTGTG